MSTQRTPPKVPRPFPAPRVTSPVVAELAGQLAGGVGSVVTERFWAHRQSPVVELDGDACVVTFLWRDADADQVLLFVNRLTDERRLGDSLMERLPGTDVWHLAYRMEPDWRASYAVLPHRPGERPPWLDGNDQVAVRHALDRGLPDPLNPQRCRNRAGVEQSVVALPLAPPQPWTARRGPLRGSRSEHTVDGRTVTVYRPAEAADRDVPLVLALDGEVWTGSQDLPAVVDNLVADREICPPVLVLLHSGDRARRWDDLGADGAVPRWVADRLAPWASIHLGASADPADRVMAGQSLGAAVALLTVSTRPDAVGRFVAQSASLWQPGLADRVAGTLPRTTDGYLEVGRQEWVLLEPHRTLRCALAARGVPHRYVEYNGGHDYACWRGGIADGLRHVLPPR